MNGKAVRFLPCFLLAALVVVQATQLAPHTCLGDLPLSVGDTANAVLDTVPQGQSTGLPICFACALASQCGAAYVDSAPAAVPPIIEGYVVGNTPPESGLDLAEALLPRPPPPTV